jgi:hypothetical protein
VVRRRLGGVRPVPSLRVDAEIEPEALTSRLALELAALEPCGAGNPRPHLLLRGVKVFGIRQVGADSDHLRCKITVGRFTFDAMAFRRGEHVEAMTDAGSVDAVVTVGAGLRGFVELELQDFGPSALPIACASRWRSPDGGPSHDHFADRRYHRPAAAAASWQRRCRDDRQGDAAPLPGR